MRLTKFLANSCAAAVALGAAALAQASAVSTTVTFQGINPGAGITAASDPMANFSANAMVCGPFIDGNGCNYRSEPADAGAVAMILGPAGFDFGGNIFVTLSGGNFFNQSFAFDVVGESLSSGDYWLLDANGGRLLGGSYTTEDQASCTGSGVPCDWKTVTLSLSEGQSAYGVEFVAPRSGFFFLDNLAFKSATGTPPGTVPEPTAPALALTALGALALARRRSRR